MGGVAFLEWVSSWWRKCVPVDLSFDVSYAQATLIELDNFPLPETKGTTLSYMSRTVSAYTLTCPIIMKID